MDRNGPQATLTRARAVSLALAIGTHFGERTQTVSRVLWDELARGYVEAMKQPIDNNWRKLPRVSELRSAAVNARWPTEREGEDLGRLIDVGGRAMFSPFVRNLAHIAAEQTLSTDTMQLIVTELMILRDRRVAKAFPPRTGLLGSFGTAGRLAKAKALSDAYMAEYPIGDLTEALSSAAEQLFYEGLRAGEDLPYIAPATDEALAGNGIRAAETLVAMARGFAGTDDRATWERLGRLDHLIEELRQPVPQRKHGHLTTV
jgi:hypothetical protein